tara:strand:+ start:88494 stop:89315 length:822 start_codon:yes stop_codon:yes gene_type:complete
MSWYQHQRQQDACRTANRAADWAKSFGMGAALGVIPAAAIILVSVQGVSPSEAIKQIGHDESRAQSIIDQVESVQPGGSQTIIQQAPPEIVQQINQEVQSAATNANEVMQQVSTSLNPQEQFTAQWETYGGRPSLFSYPDADSKSIGYGFFLGNPSARNRIEELGYNFEAVYNGEQPISPEHATKLFREDIKIATRDAQQLFPSYTNQPAAVQLILTDMAYNLGIDRLSRFSEFRAAIEAKDYQEAAKELVDSRWYGQVGNRSKNHVRTLQGI